MALCLLFFSLISTLATTSYSLSCFDCTEATDVPCTGEVKVCSSSEDACISRSSLITVAGIQVSKIFSRGCEKRSQCSLSGSMSFPEARTFYSSTCCYTDRCMPSRPILPPITSNKNGVVCKSCQSFQNYPCDSDKYMNCVGNETKCISQVTMPSGTPATAVRGCSTPDLCKHPQEEGSLAHLKYTARTTCTDGAASLHYCLYLLSVTAIWLFKVMN